MASSMNIHLVWLDANMYSEANKELLKKLREMNKECIEFVEESECLRFLGRGVGDPRQFIFIVSGALGQEIKEEIYEHENILSVYVYCAWREKHEQWAKKYHKAKVVTSTEELLSKLKLELDRFGKH